MSSTFVVRGECKICLEDRIEVDSFKVFPCGHCFCQNCIHDLFALAERRRIQCPLCRKQWLNADATKLIFFPVIVDSTKSSVDHVVDGLNRMDKNCKILSVKRAHIKLAKAAETTEGDNAERLRKAIDDFAQRIIPLFEELDLGRKRIKELEESQHSRFQDLTTKARRADSLQKELISVRKSREELETNLMEALDSADALRIKAEKLQSSLTGVRENLASKEEECRRVMDSLNRFKSSDVTKSKRIKVLKQETDELKAMLMDKENKKDVESSSMVIDQDWIPDVDQPPSLPALYRHSNEQGWVATDNFQFEGMPEPGFKPAWNVVNSTAKKPKVLLKKPHSGSKGSHSISPLTLDTKGRPTVPVQTGPKLLVRTVQRF